MVKYSQMNYNTLIICMAPISKREELAKAALEVAGVEVQEVITGEENVHVPMVGEDGDDLTRIGRELSDIGLHIADEDIGQNHYTPPQHKFNKR